MKRKYLQPNGEIIELEDKEFLNMTGNSRLTLLDREPEQKEPNFDKMSKDELLDYTAVKGIEADYSMTKKEIKDIIKKNKE